MDPYERSEELEVETQEGDETIDIETGDDDRELSPEEITRLLHKIQSEQNLLMGIVFATLAGLVAAAIWAGIAYATGYQIGWLAIGVGALVGFAMRLGGKGIDSIYGILGGIISFLSVVLGNIFAVFAFVALENNVGFYDVLVNFDYTRTLDLLIATFSPIDLLFYGLAIWEGYKFSFRQITENDLANLEQGII